MTSPDRGTKHRALTIIAAVAVWIVPAATQAQDSAGNSGAVSTSGTYAFQGIPVSAILVHAPDGLHQPATEALAIRVGEPFEIADMRRTLQNIYSLGVVSDVQVNGRKTEDGGVLLEFTVLPAAHLHAVRFVGDSPFRKSILEDALTATLGDRISRQMLQAQATRVRQALANRGYEQARVEPELVLDETGLEGTIVFHLDAGSATRLRRLEFVGNPGISDAEVRAAFGLAESSVFRPDDLGDSIDRLLRRLAEARFFYASVEIGPGAVNPSENTRDLQIIIEAGPHVELNVTGWDRSEEELRDMLPFFEATTVADWILKQARADIIAQLQQQGHWKPLVAFGRERDSEGRNVVVNFTVIPARKVDVERIEIVGNEQIPTATIRSAMRTEERRLLRGAPFLSTTWQQDQRNILALYRRSGFLQVSIVDTVSYDDEIGGLRARLEIDEGGRTIVDRVVINPQTHLDAHGIDTTGWAQEIQLRAGGPYDPDALQGDETRLRILLANQGFRRATVIGEAQTRPDPYSMGVTFSVFPGPRVRVGQLLISGNQKVRDEVIRRQLSLVPGSPYTQESVILSQSRLYQLGLFSRVDIDTARPDSTETEPTVVVRVEEGSSRRLSWGLGYSTEEQVRGLVVVGQENLWERNHRATFSVRASFAEQRARFIYTDPYLLGRDVEGSAVAYFESVDREGFKAQSFGTSFRLVKRHSPTLTSVGRYSFRNQQTFDVLIDEELLEPEDRDAVIGSAIYTLLSDTRPNPINPRGGNYHTVDLEWAANALGSESNFVKMFGRSYWYWELPNDAVFVAAARAGLAVPFGDSIVPLPERFFAGGSTTLRGFGRNRAGSTDEDGNPLGGNVLLIGNLEYRFPIRGDLGAVIFTDIGSVFDDLEHVSVSGIRETLGVGVRYDSPIGPLRLDWGYLLDARTGEDSSRFHFAIGQAF